MKSYYIKADTPVSVYTSKTQEATDEELKQLEDVMKQIAEKGSYFTMKDDDDNQVILPTGVITNTVFTIVVYK